MTPKEFIDENYFSLTLDCKREINEIYQAIEDYAKAKQLTLTDVGCRKLNEWIKIDPTKANTIPRRTCMDYDN